MKTTEASSSSFHSGIETIFESDPDDDNLANFENPGLRERRRRLHTEAEQRRRNAIKKGFDRIVDLLHPVNNKTTYARMNKSVILQKSISKIQKLMKLRDQKNTEYEFFEKNVLALSAFHKNYEKIAHDELNNKNTNSIPEQLKLRVFQMFADHLFSSFESVATVTSYDLFCHSVIEWLEGSCTPERLSPLMDSVLAGIFGPVISGRQQESDCPPGIQFPSFGSHGDHRSADATVSPTNHRSMLLDNAFTPANTNDGFDPGQVPSHRAYSLPFSMSNQCAGESLALFRGSNSSSSIGACLSSSEFVDPVQLATSDFFPRPPSTTDTMGLSVVTENPANCALPRFPSSRLPHSVNKLPFCTGDVNLPTFLDEVYPCGALQSQRYFRDDGPPARGHIQGSSSAAASNFQSELCNSIGPESSLQYL